MNLRNSQNMVPISPAARIENSRRRMTQRLAKILFCPVFPGQGYIFPCADDHDLSEKPVGIVKRFGRRFPPEEPSRKPHQSRICFGDLHASSIAEFQMGSIPTR